MNKPAPVQGFNNEEIYAEFERIALGLIKEGRRHYSSDGILHVVRYNTRARGDGFQFKVNNNLSAEFSRRFMREHPSAEGFFQLRKSKLDESEPTFSQDGQGQYFFA